MSQFCYYCPRCEFAVSTDAQNRVCLQCGLSATPRPASHDEEQTLSYHSLSRVPRSLLNSGVLSGLVGLCVATALRSSALESNVVLGTLAIMGVFWCAPGTLREWNTRLLQR